MRWASTAACSGWTPTTAWSRPRPTPASWLVAYGQRNPWRLTFRPKADGTGTSNELWSGDVGASKAEEVNRIPDITTVTTPVNRGWPCYEGNYVESAVQPALGRAQQAAVRDALRRRGWARCRSP